MKKLITNEKAERIQKEIGPAGCFLRLDGVKSPEERQRLLEAKLLEEFAEYLISGDPCELRDVIRVARALLGEDDCFSQGMVLTNEL